MKEYEYETLGLSDNLVVVDMSDLTGDVLEKIADIIDGDTPGESNLYAAKRLEFYHRLHHLQNKVVL